MGRSYEACSFIKITDCLCKYGIGDTTSGVTDGGIGADRPLAS